MIRLTKKAERALTKLEKQFPGETRLVAVTRNWAEIKVGDSIWEFKIDDNQQLYLVGTHSYGGLTKLAFFKALEGIAAVRAGHNKATVARRVAKEKKGIKIRRSDIDQNSFSFILMPTKKP